MIRTMRMLVVFAVAVAVLAAVACGGSSKDTAVLESILSRQ